MTTAQDSAIRNARHWRRTRSLTLSLLLVWALATFFVIFFARELSGFTLLGWPLSFYMAAQGLVVIYLALVGIYTWQMKRFDRDATMPDPLSHGKSQQTETHHEK